MPLPPGFTVRDLEPDDLPDLVQLVARCDATYRDWAPGGWEPPDPRQRRAHSRERLQDPRRWSRGVFDAEGCLVAFAAWEQFKDPDTDGDPPGLAHLSAVFVDPTRWRQGIASFLLDQAEQSMRARGYHVARLWTPEEAPAQRFYEAHGWRPDGRRKWHERLRLDIIGYEKPLTPRGRPGQQA